MSIQSNPFTEIRLEEQKRSVVDILQPSRRISSIIGKGSCCSSAIVYCEGNFGSVDGKTANGLVRHSEKYEILSVIDSEKAGQDAGEVLDGVCNSIPIHSNLDSALSRIGYIPEFLIFGIAPATGTYSAVERRVILDAITRGMNIINGLHEFLNDDPEITAVSKAHKVNLFDVRRPPEKNDLRLFDGRIADIDCPRIAVLGTDCAIGKRTTATLVTKALNDYGLHAVMVGTGQTGIIQGARYGVALDAIPSQFCAGELEGVVLAAYDNEDPDVIIIEGQGALSHPAYLTSGFILRGSQPQGVILQHAPGRRTRVDYDRLPMPTVQSEIELIQVFSQASIIGLTLNHQGMTMEEMTMAIDDYEQLLGMPVTDPLTRSSSRLVDMVLSAFPRLEVPSVVLAT